MPYSQKIETFQHALLLLIRSYELICFCEKYHRTVKKATTTEKKTAKMKKLHLRIRQALAEQLLDWNIAYFADQQSELDIAGFQTLKSFQKAALELHIRFVEVKEYLGHDRVFDYDITHLGSVARLIKDHFTTYSGALRDAKDIPSEQLEKARSVITQTEENLFYFIEQQCLYGVLSDELLSLCNELKEEVRALVNIARLKKNLQALSFAHQHFGDIITSENVATHHMFTDEELEILREEIDAHKTTLEIKLVRNLHQTVDYLKTLRPTQTFNLFNLCDLLQPKEFSFGALIDQYMTEIKDKGVLTTCKHATYSCVPIDAILDQAIRREESRIYREEPRIHREELHEATTRISLLERFKFAFVLYRRQHVRLSLPLSEIVKLLSFISLNDCQPLMHCKSQLSYWINFIRCFAQSFESKSQVRVDVDILKEFLHPNSQKPQYTTDKDDEFNISECLYSFFQNILRIESTGSQMKVFIRSAIIELIDFFNEIIEKSLEHDLERIVNGINDIYGRAQIMGILNEDYPEELPALRSIRQGYINDLNKKIALTAATTTASTSTSTTSSSSSNQTLHG